jgi:hypothetical protein
VQWVGSALGAENMNTAVLKDRTLENLKLPPRDLALHCRETSRSGTILSSFHPAT